MVDSVVNIIRSTKNRKIGIVLISAASLVAGCCVYAFIRVTPTALEVYIRSYFDLPRFMDYSIYIEHEVARLLINSYAADALWMLSFSTGCYLLFVDGSNISRQRNSCFYLAGTVGVFLELLQATGYVYGTFDYFDICVFIIFAYLGSVIASKLC